MSDSEAATNILGLANSIISSLDDARACARNGNSNVFTHLGTIEGYIDQIQTNARNLMKESDAT